MNDQALHECFDQCDPYHADRKTSLSKGRS